ncbi:MAG: hypothetical protein ACTSV3_00950 [Candidatus Thorarchaeota archaeon]
MRLQEVEDEELVNRLEEVIAYVKSTRSDIDNQSEKLQVALSGILRLTGNTDTMLSNLQGNPEELGAYLIKLSTELSDSFKKHMNHLSRSLVEIRELVSKP